MFVEILRRLFCLPLLIIILFFQSCNEIKGTLKAEGDDDLSGLINTPFTFEVNTNLTGAGRTANNQYRLPTISLGTYDFVVDWGDGSTDHITSWDQAETVHTYPAPGIYEISMSGIFNRLEFNRFFAHGLPRTVGNNDGYKLLRILSWSANSFITMEHMFWNCTNLYSITETSAPKSLDGF